MSSNKQHLITQTNQLFTLIICQAKNTTKFGIQAWDSFKQKKKLLNYIMLLIIESSLFIKNYFIGCVKMKFDSVKFFEL